MTFSDDELRAAFAARPDAPQGDACPTPDALLAAFAGEAPRAARRAVVAHLATCAACAADWRLAHLLLPGVAGEAAQGEEPEPAPVVRGPWLRPALLAVAAALCVALGVGLWPRLTSRVTPGYRDAGGLALRALVADGAPLPRDAFRLRWAFAEAGARYAVTVSDEALEPLAEARDLEPAEFVVPPGALGARPDGALLLWQVEARLPDGRQVRSSTFRVRIGPPSGGRGTQTR